MSIIEGFEFGLVFAGLLYWGWRWRSPVLLYAFAGVAALAAIAGSSSYLSFHEAPYAWIFVAGLASAGFMLDRRH